MSYCTYVNTLPAQEQPEHRHYHNHQYGFPIDSDDELFGRLILEINQAGLSWTTILKKEANFRQAYSGYSIAAIAAYGEADRQRLLNDAGIIRNRLKVDAAIYNAGIVVQLQQSHGSFKKWIEAHHPLRKEEWVKLFKKHFRFTGGEIVNEFLMSTGYLPGAHDEDCPVFENALKAGAAWYSARR